tara:strand:- start:314 stop:2497 length:2184 start_codon:yes stop_codon:yes gene_type:complete
MALQEVNISPGFNKQATPTGAPGQWIDGDFVRFRYGLPEKIGGWSQLTSTTMVGAARDQLVWADLDSRKYVAIGTNKALVIYYEGAFYDITPLAAAQTGATFTADGSVTLTVNLVAHGMIAGDLFTFTGLTPPQSGGADIWTASVFTTNTFEVITATSNTFTITMPNVGTGGSVVAGGSATVNPYITFGPLFQTRAFGFGTGLYGGTVQGAATTTLNGSLANDTAGNNGSATEITLTSVTGFPTVGTNFITVGGTEIISYTGVAGLKLTGITRGVSGSTRSAHGASASVQNATAFVGWGQSSPTSEVTLEPASWSLHNFGEKLIATVKNGKTFEWSPLHATGAALTTRAATVTNAPEKSMMSIVSDRDRHLILLGTQTDVTDNTTQDKMFIRFSDQENINDYTPTATNTAGTFRLDSGTKIVGAVQGKDYILILTDTSAYVMQFVGPPFTFSIRQVGTNCGLIGQHALRFINGACYWMAEEGGFFMFDGTVKGIPCLVEDFVFTNKGDNLGLNYNSNNIIYAGLNHLYSEINWFYPKDNSAQNDRVVTYNYEENTWATGSLDRSSWTDATLFAVPYATDFIETNVPSFPVIQGATAINGASTYYAQEVGNNQVDFLGNATAINAFIQSGDFDLDVEGNGQFLMSIRRFVPDFKLLTGYAKITLNLRKFPSDTATSSPLGPFTIFPNTQKKDTRARARFASLKIENDAIDQTWRYGTFRADTQPDGMR